MEAVTVASRRRTRGDRVPRTRDEELMLRIAEGDADAFAQLVRRHGPKVHGLARRVLRRADLAEDVTRESFHHMWQHAARYSPDRGSVEVWLMTIAHQASIDLLRRIQTQRPLAVVPPDEVTGGRLTGDLVARMDDVIDQRTMRAAMTALPTLQRRVIEMMYLDGRTLPQVAERLGLPLGTVRGGCLLGMRTLRDALASPGSS